LSRVFFFSVALARLRYPPSFPTRRSSDLLRFRFLIKSTGDALKKAAALLVGDLALQHPVQHLLGDGQVAGLGDLAVQGAQVPLLDRKSTRLNSSHVTTSYAVFCLKKKSDI